MCPKPQARFDQGGGTRREHGEEGLFEIVSHFEKSAALLIDADLRATVARQEGRTSY